MPHAVLLAGSGVLGRAIALRLLDAGWTVDVTGRDSAKMPDEVRAAGGRFVTSDRTDSAALARAIGSGADLAVDGACYTSAEARMLVPLLGDVGSTVMLSSKAVYVDAAGRHVNSDVAPRFDGPIRENHPTMAPRDGDHTSREGYGPNKVAAEQVLLDSGHPVTVVRASKVHGAGAARPREWVFVKRILDGRNIVFLNRHGSAIDHTTAATNTAALIERVATIPGARILNSADPDAPSVLQISRAIAAHLGHEWQEVLIEGGGPLGCTPWGAEHPIVLDTSASLALGYRPVGDFATTIVDEIDWLLTAARGGADAARLPDENDPFFEPFFDYAAEDASLDSGRSDS